jgi:hypothetical protein
MAQSELAHIPFLKNGEPILTASLITLVTLLERLLASGILSLALSAPFKKTLIPLGAH